MNKELINIFDQMQFWINDHGITVLIIIVSTWILSKFIDTIVVRLIRRAIPRGAFVSEEEEEKREKTLIKISQGFFGIFIWIAAIIAILDTMGVPVAPLITGAGIVGVAIGFGSQSLVKDIITGLFVIAENQFRIGDFVCLGEYCGTVEDMTLRVTKLRQVDGTIHYVPNGEIKVASNKSKDYSKVDIKIHVGYHTDIDTLETIINKVGDSLAHDEVLGQHIIDAPHFLRIDELSDYSITAHISGKVYPKKQYLINGEMRRRLKDIFKEEGIEIPYPTRVVHNFQK